jgi:hypothetical protein
MTDRISPVDIQRLKRLGMTVALVVVVVVLAHVLIGAMHSIGLR